MEQKASLPAPALAGSAFSPIRITDLNRVICIRLKLRYALAVESRFTLHSASGARLRDGSIQIDRVAGFCHLRNALQNYWTDQIATVRDPDSSDEINDLGAWLLSLPPDTASAEAAGMRRERSARMPREAVVQKRQRGHLTRTLEKAISHAQAYGFADIASRLQGIMATLPAEQND